MIRLANRQLLLFLLLSTSAPALGQLVPVTRQITSNVDCHSVADGISDDASKLSVISSCRLAGDSSSSDTHLYVVDRASSTISAVTSGDNCVGPQFSVISGDGQRVAFSSRCGLLGPNPQNQSQIFVWDARNNSLQQISEAPACFHHVPRIAPNGSWVTFVTGCPPDYHQVIVRKDLDTGSLETLIEFAPNCFQANYDISADGSQMAIATICTLGQSDDRTPQLYRFDTAAKAATLLGPLCGSSKPVMSRDGNRILVESTCDLTGGNPDQRSEVFLFERSGSITQITESPFVCGIGTAGYAFDSNASNVVLSWRCGPATTNPEQNLEIFRYDIARAEFTQLTRSPGDCGNGNPLVSANGSIAFSSDCDLTGENPDRSTEIFLTTFEVPTPSPTMSSVPVFTPTHTATHSATATATATPTAIASTDCTGDCNGNGAVTVDELIVGVNIALGTQPLGNCPSFDSNSDGKTTVNELVGAVGNALAGCSR